MAEMESLPALLRTAFLDHGGVNGGENGTRMNFLDEVIMEWVLRLRSAFYSPHRTAKDATVSKFLQLETALFETFEQLAVEHSDTFWSFLAALVLALSCEPLAEPTATVEPTDPSPLNPSVTSTAIPQGNSKRKTKPTRARAQPNAPLAFVVISALKKLITTPGNEHFESKCLSQGRENASLRAFCELQLRNPESRQVDAKLLVEIIDVFCVEPEEMDQIRALAAHLLATKSHSSLIKLCQTFETRVDWDFEDVIRKMIQSKDWGSAELVAKTFQRNSEQKELAKVLVDEAIQGQDFKRAHRIVHNFGLQHDFPDIDQLYSRDAVLKLIEKQKWALALAYVGSDTTLQTVLLTHLVAAKEFRLASALATDRMGMTDFDPETLDTESLIGTGNASSLANLPVHGYLELPLSEDTIVFCETEEAVREAAQHFFSRQSETPALVGLDVEWRPTSTKIASHTGALTTTAVASILQIATATRVFLIDLLALHDNAFLFDEFLKPLFSSDAFLKLGFGFDSDLKVLHQTFPERVAFKTVSPFLELGLVVQKAYGTSVGNSLSNATTRILGKPLDKRMQLSNWDERPLSHSQVVYAALDAFCLLQIVEHIQEHGLVDDKAAVTTWDDVEAHMIGNVWLSSPIDEPAAIAEAVDARIKYQLDWHSKCHRTGVIEAKDLLSTAHVQAYWEAKAHDRQDGELKSLELVPVQDLEPLLAIAEQDPTAYVAINSICFFADEKPCVACIDSNAKLDTSRLAGLCGLSRRKIKLATAVECELIWGFSPGTVPPFAHRATREYEIPIFVDITLREFTQWVTGSGSHDQLLVFHSKAFFDLIPVKTVADIALHRNGTRQRQQEDESSKSSVNGLDASNEPLEYKFLADTMVGRVGRWLRTIGIDVVLWDATTTYDSSVDRKSALLALAAREQRIVLTRDKKLADRRDAGACFVVSSDDPHAQFQEIKAHFALELKKEEMMTRCAKCNHKGFEIVDLEYVKRQMEDVVHAHVLEVVTEFWKCLACHKIYWEGPKYSSAYENMVQKFQNAEV